mmetsp:Transcript_128015/g.221197  ORF Transcript_128015/g.221197 Transcript_128015/m.221197 type:complete len:224 (+) Transcript_128015:449-1120(+)
MNNSCTLTSGPKRKKLEQYTRTNHFSLSPKTHKNNDFHPSVVSYQNRRLHKLSTSADLLIAVGHCAQSCKQNTYVVFLASSCIFFNISAFNFAFMASALDCLASSVPGFETLDDDSVCVGLTEAPRPVSSRTAGLLCVLAGQAGARSSFTYLESTADCSNAVSSFPWWLLVAPLLSVVPLASLGDVFSSPPARTDNTGPSCFTGVLPQPGEPECCDIRRAARW